MDVATEKETLIVKVNTQNQIMRIVLIVKTKKNTICIQNMFWELGIFMYWTGNSMNNLLSYCGLVDAKIRASDKDLSILSNCENSEKTPKSTETWKNYPSVFVVLGQMNYLTCNLELFGLVLLNNIFLLHSQNI